jgi:chemotaxis methyl-accepting protein methylase
MNKDLKRILHCLNTKRGFDFSGYCTSIMERLISQRFSMTNCHNYDTYFHYLQDNTDEFDQLVDVLTINVSRFFRNTLTFDYIASQILPSSLSQKKTHKNLSFRVWSAGCSMGEEAYSIAILINELLEKEALDYDVRIFATDINCNILKKAQQAEYPFESIENIKYKLLKKYFTNKGDLFLLKPEIKNMVSFSLYDIMYKKVSLLRKAFSVHLTWCFAGIF